MPDVSEALTRKIGPLPAWGWGVAVGGAALGVKMVRGGGGTSRQVIEVPTGAPYPSDELASQFGSAIDEIRDRLDDIEQDTNTNTDDDADVPSPSNPMPATSWGQWRLPTGVTETLPDWLNLNTWIIGLRARFPQAAAIFQKPQPAGETPEQREARLQAEISAYGPAAFAWDLGTFVRGLRARYPTIAKLWTEKQVAGETAAQRNARLMREIAFFASRGIGEAASAQTMMQAPPVSTPSGTP